MLDLSREQMALLRCLRSVVCESQDDLEDLANADWSQVFEAARLHQVSGLVYETLGRPALKAAVPKDVRKRWGLAYHLTGVRNEYFRRCIVEILRKTRREKIDIMLLKGAVLAYSAYRRSEHRWMADVDLLVREHDFPALRRVLYELGYRTTLPQLRSEELPRYAHYYQQVGFGCRRKPPLETHFRLLNLGIPPIVEPAWDDASVIAFADAEAWCPSSERFLLHLCLHAQQHAFSCLRYFVDIAAWTRSREIDTERFVDLARRHHLSSVAYYALTYVTDILEVPGFESIRARLRPGVWKRRVFEFVWRDERVRSHRASPGPIETELPKAFLLGDAPIRDKIILLWNVMVPPREWLSSYRGRRETRWSRLATVFLGACKGLTAILRTPPA